MLRPACASVDAIGGGERCSPACGPFEAALVEDGIPFTAFAVEDARTEFDRLRALGVRFTQDPLAVGRVTTAVLDDTCGNLIQIFSPSAG